MPEGADPDGASWKDYVMGTGYDGTPKDACLGRACCAGVPADTIRCSLPPRWPPADKVNFFTCAHVRGEDSRGRAARARAFYTMALMHGGIGTPGHYLGWSGVQDLHEQRHQHGGRKRHRPPSSTPPTRSAPAGSPAYMYYPIPVFARR